MSSWLSAAALIGVASLPGEPGVIPDNAHKVAEHRFKAVGDLEAVMKFYKSALPASAYPRKQIVNQPGIKALHILNPTGKGGWEGLNIYESNDEVRIYVVVGPAESGKKKKSK